MKGLVNRKNISSRVIVLMITIAVCISAMSILKPSTFLTVSNLSSSLTTVTFNLILACGMTVVLMLGCVDLSVGPIVAFSSVIAAQLMQGGAPVFLAILAALAAGMIIGAINGALVGYGHLAPFVATLGTQSVLRGVNYVMTNGYTITGLPSGFANIGQGTLFGIPNLILISAMVVIVLAILVPRNSFFKKVYLVGTSRQVAYMSGINANRILMGGYALSGLCAALCGVLMCSRYAMGNAAYANGYETQAIAAAVIGGAVMSGGEGNIFGTVLGVMLVAIVNNSFIQFGGNAEWQTAISGIMLVLTLFIDVMHNKRAERRGLI
ncbi:ABC transporter permease [Anaerolentibacter hominis]|uniref:ABC transporter permease n=1 Tax=Anaerolentibacter hominis TaxID=3079009 RepID=UPI0031B8904B